MEALTFIGWALVVALGLNVLADIAVLWRKRRIRRHRRACEAERAAERYFHPGETDFRS